MSDLARWGLALLATPLFAGCCTTMADQTEGYAQGWRRARVEALVAAQAPVRSAYLDCRPTARPTDHPIDTAGGPYVLASYSFGGNPNLRHTMVVPIPADMRVALGQPIRINITHCETALPAGPATY